MVEINLHGQVIRVELYRHPSPGLRDWGGGVQRRKEKMLEAAKLNCGASREVRWLEMAPAIATHKNSCSSWSVPQIKTIR